MHRRVQAARRDTGNTRSTLPLRVGWTHHHTRVRSNKRRRTMTRTNSTGYPELLWPFKNLPQDYVVLDLETTGLFDESGAPSILTIGVVEVVAGEPVGGAEFCARPRRSITREASAIHGITERKAAGFPELEESWETLTLLLQGKLVVIHNASFDWLIIRDAAITHRLQVPAIQGVFCSQRSAQPWAVANGIETSSRGPSLDALTQALALPDRRSALDGQHGALIDARQSVDIVESLRRRSGSH